MHIAVTISMYFLYISANSILFVDMYRKYIEIDSNMHAYNIDTFISIRKLHSNNYIAGCSI